MIAVVNVSKEYSRKGVQQYEVRLNRFVLSKFEHTSEHGMAECLRKAADAVDSDEGKCALQYLDYMVEHSGNILP